MKKCFAFTAFAVVCLGIVGFASAADTPSMQQIYTDTRAAMAPLQEQLYNKRAELAAVYNTATPDQGKIQSLVNEIATLQAQLINTRLEADSRMAAAPEYTGPGYHHGMGMGAGTGMGHRMGGGMGGGRRYHNGGHGGYRGGCGW